VEEDDENDEQAVDIGLARRSVLGPHEGGLTREQAALANRDVAALNALKDVLRGLVWSEEALGIPPSTASAFLDDLEGAVESATYLPPLPRGEPGIFVGSVAQARGLPFDVVALVGLAEGEFPSALREDTWLRDAERRRLNESLGSSLRLRTESAEAEAFYGAITRPRCALLLTRPRIADNGAPWQPSPYWEDVLLHLDAVPRLLTTASRTEPDACASWPELWQAVAADPSRGAAHWAKERRPLQAQAIHAGAQALEARLARPAARSALDGDLSGQAAYWADLLGLAHRWSVSQLETYRSCPYHYLVDRMALRPREIPAEDLQPEQVGTLYHRILAELYRSVGPGAGLEALLEGLDAVATPILEAAPRELGFRPTAWWQYTRKTMLRNLRRSMAALERLDPGYRFWCAERRFGSARDGGELYVRSRTGDVFRLRGIIDRIDRDDQGRLRVVDYKSGAVSDQNARALSQGRDLQIALYALAAEQALALGEVAEGLYWSVSQAEASSLRLASFGVSDSSGPRVAMRVATEHASAAVTAARGGDFRPTVPHGGCPGYCPAAAYCWHYREASW